MPANRKGQKSAEGRSGSNRRGESDASAAIAIVISLVLLLASLLFGGVAPAAPAALFSALTMGAVIMLAALRPKESLARALYGLKIPAIFYGLFLAYALFSVTPLSSAFAHPAWANASLQGPASLTPYRTIEGISASISQAGFALLGAFCVDTRSDRDRVGRGLILMSLILAVCGFFWLVADIAEYRRLRLRLDSANAAATMFGMLALTAMTLWMRGFYGRLHSSVRVLPGKFHTLQRFIAAPVSLAAFVFCIACVIMTASRGGILAGLASLIVLSTLLIFSQRTSEGEHKGKFWRPTLALGGVAAALVLFGGQFLFERFGAFDDTSNAGRRIVIETHWRAFQERPVWGHGLNTFHAINEAGASAENWTATQVAGATYNIFVQALEEGGLIGGGLLFAAFGALILSALWRALKGSSGREWAAAAFAASLLALLHGLVDFGLNIPAISALLCFMLGAFTVSTRKTNTKRTDAA